MKCTKGFVSRSLWVPLPVACLGSITQGSMAQGSRAGKSVELWNNSMQVRMPVKWLRGKWWKLGISLQADGKFKFSGLGQMVKGVHQMSNVCMRSYEVYAVCRQMGNSFYHLSKLCAETGQVVKYKIWLFPNFILKQSKCKKQQQISQCHSSAFWLVLISHLLSQ